MKTNEIKNIIEEREEFRGDGGTSAIASSIASAYGYDFPAWLFKKVSTAVRIKNHILKQNPELDMRVNDLSRGNKHTSNQLTFAF